LQLEVLAYSHGKSGGPGDITLEGAKPGVECPSVYEVPQSPPISLLPSRWTCLRGQWLHQRTVEDVRCWATHTYCPTKLGADSSEIKTASESPA